MKLSGEFIKVLPLEIKETFGISDSYPLKDGGFLIQLSFMSAPEIKKDYFLYKSPRLLARIDSKGKVISDITRTEHFTRISSGSDGGDSPLPYTPVFQWVPYKDETVIFADGMSKKFVVFDYEGNLVRETVTDLSEPDKVTSRDLNAWRTRREELYRDRNPKWWQRFGSVIEKYKKSLYKKPNLNTISRTFEGNILVSGPSRYGQSEEDFWLLDDNGKIMAHIQIAGYVVGISENFVFVNTVDEEGIVLVHCVERKWSEKEDFLRIRELIAQE